MSRLALHPRLSHMVMRAAELGARDSACELAALLTERDLLRRAEGVTDADIRTRLDLLRGTVARGRRGPGGAAAGPGRGRGVSPRRGGGRCRREARSERRCAAGARPTPIGSPSAGRDGWAIPAAEWPRRLPRSAGLSREEYLVARELDGRARRAGSCWRPRSRWRSSGSGSATTIVAGGAGGLGSRRRSGRWHDAGAARGDRPPGAAVARPDPARVAGLCSRVCARRARRPSLGTTVQGGPASASPSSEPSIRAGPMCPMRP